MARLGDTIDPRLFINDYSGLTRAAEMQAQGIANASNIIGGAVGDYRERQKKAKEDVRASAAQIKAAATLFPEQKPLYDSLLADLNNEDTPISERAAIAPAIRELVNWNIVDRTNQQDFKLRSEELGIRRADQQLRQDETRLGMEIQSANQGFRQQEQEFQMQQRENESQVKSAIGPGLLQSVIDMAPKSLTSGLGNINELSPDQQFNLAESIMQLVPKEKTAAPTVIDIPVPGGTQKAQFDPTSGKFIPVQTAGLMTPTASLPGDINPTGGVGDEGSGLLPPPETIPDIAYPPGFQPTPVDQKAQLEVERLKAEMVDKAAKDEAKNKTSQRVLKLMDKYMTFDGKPKAALRDAVGVGEGVGSWVGQYTGGLLGNTAETRANQKELQLELLEKDLLDAAKDLKPVSEDEMNQLIKRRPELTDPPEVWARFMQRAKEIMAADGSAVVAPQSPEQEKATKIQEGNRILDSIQR